MAGEELVPFLDRQLRLLLDLFADGGGGSVLLEDQDELIVQLEDAVARIGERAHDRGAAGRVAGGHFLPDDGAHVVKAYGLAELDDLRADGNDFVTAIVHGTRKLVADVHAQPAALGQDPVTFGPDEVQVIDVSLVAVVEADLPAVAVVFQLPVGRRGDDEVDRFVRHLGHTPRVARDDSVVCLHCVHPKRSTCRMVRLYLLGGRRVKAARCLAASSVSCKLSPPGGFNACGAGSRRLGGRDPRL